MNIPVTPLDAPVAASSRFARGWHCLGLSRHFGDTPKSLDYFGTRLVAFRGADYKVHILDAFCPHMGADMALGVVKGNHLVCPFHRWEWGTDGICKKIPYAKNIPDKARIKSWPTLEKNGLLYVWHDAEGNAPIAEQMIPDMPEYYSEDWSDWHMNTIRVNNNNRELIDNMADMGHFAPVHNANPKLFRNIVEGHTFTQIMEGRPEDSDTAESMTSIATYHGPAVMMTQMAVTLVGGMVMESRLLVANVPVNDNCFDLHFGLVFKRFPELPRDLSDYIIQKHVDSTTQGFMDDVAIWHNKIRVDNPVLCDGDGPINKLRQWYRQFYLDVEAVGDKWKERKEYQTHIHNND
ncbi:MAG TPA: Rieske 2Fe-2S domain-containing protein [Pseudomonadales bacterium]